MMKPVELNTSYRIKTSPIKNGQFERSSFQAAESYHRGLEPDLATQADKIKNASKKTSPRHFMRVQEGELIVAASSSPSTVRFVVHQDRLSFSINGALAISLTLLPEKETIISSTDAQDRANFLKKIEKRQTQRTVVDIAGQRLKALRIVWGYRHQYPFALAAKVARTSLNRIENGAIRRIEENAKVLNAIADFGGITIKELLDYLLAEEGDPPIPQRLTKEE